MAGSRAVSFGDEAEAYDRYRPSYPDVLIDDLLVDEPRAIADIGCGTGIAGRLFVARGHAVVGVEPDERMAAVARRHGLDVVLTPFEEWAPANEFDLLIAGQSWHWVDQTRGPLKAAAVLRAGGRFAAFWNSYQHEPAVAELMTRVYERCAPELLEFSVTLGRIQADDPIGDDMFGAALRATGAFADVTRRRYGCVRRYNTDAWLSELATHSGYHALEPARRDALFAGLRSCLAGRGGALDVTLRTGLVTATRTPD